MRYGPFCPFWFRAFWLKLNMRKKGTLIIKGLLRNLEVVVCVMVPVGLQYITLVIIAAIEDLRASNIP